MVIVALTLAAGALTGCKHTNSVAHGSSRGQQYTCFMHPEVVTTTPGKCPKCGMDLEAK